MDRIYVTGHRNPDTDSIVSAMAYAALRNALGDAAYCAARLGHISDETHLVLNRFGFAPPVHIKTMRTQVRDLDFDTPPQLDCGVSIGRAWDTLHEQDKFSSIPITADGGKLYGMLTSGDIAEYDMSAARDPMIRDLPLFNLLGVLEGRVMNDSGKMPDRISGEIVVALPHAHAAPLFSTPQTIAVCGQQPEAIAAALEMQASCLILCQTELDGELRNKIIHAPGTTCVIATPLDAYRAVRMIHQAISVSHICRTTDLVCFHLDDFIDDVRKVVLQSRYRSYPILDENEHVVGTLSRYHLISPRRKRVVLVDHNEAAQSVPGLEQAEILEIIDHHRLADIQTTSPIYFRNEPVGSTATIIAEMYQEKGLMPTQSLAGLMTAAILSDTVMFKSPTCTQRDRNMAERLARIAGVSLQDLGKEIFSVSADENKSASDLLFTDFKEFHIAGHDFGISQITCLDSQKMMERSDDFLDVMQKTAEAHRYGMMLLMLTDVLLEGTQLLFVGDREAIQHAFNTEIRGNSVFLPHVMSRKKQVVPMLSALWG